MASSQNASAAQASPKKSWADICDGPDGLDDVPVLDGKSEVTPTEASSAVEPAYERLLSEETKGSSSVEDPCVGGVCVLGAGKCAPGMTCTTNLQPYYDKLKELQNNGQFTRQEIANNPMVVLTDICPDTGVEMYCYDHGLETDQMDLITQECRGVVFTPDGKLVSRAFGHTPVFSVKTFPKDLREFVEEHFDACQFFPSVEGALVRAFYHDDADGNGGWFLTTHRKLDAYASFWSGRTSFGQLFDQALAALFAVTGNEQFKGLTGSDLTNNFLNSLDKEKQYVFLIQNTWENRLVCYPPPVPGVLYVGTFKDGQMIPNDDKVPVPQQQPLQFANLDEALATVDRVHPYQFQGFILFAPNGRQYKIYSEAYKTLFELRNNTPSVMFRYLQVRGDADKAAQFVALYPEWGQKIAQYESVIQTVAGVIYAHYVRRFVNQEKGVVLPQQEYKVMSAVHSWYQGHRAQGHRLKVKVENVLHQLNRSNPSDLNHMIRRHMEAVRKVEAEKASQQVDDMPELVEAPEASHEKSD